MSRRIDHERICVPAIRRRREREGKPPAAWVVDAWRMAQRRKTYRP